MFRPALHSLKFKLGLVGAGFQQPGRGVLPVEIVLVFVVIDQQPAAKTAHAGLGADVRPDPVAAGVFGEAAIRKLAHALAAVGGNGWPAHAQRLGKLRFG